ncbi:MULTISPECIES: hypothetical protein [Micrococcus]|uniref:hypothetical protein n=1 Tax=Micrococcus TaxID=1269 RepID=UPI000A61AD75|nr:MULTISPECIES: hypothetical protein [Micrococcus]WIK83274.1 hypothetical protein CJ228_005640 [Micrococcus lylae]
MTTPHPRQPDNMSGRANLQRGLETVGGHLSLVSDRLVFTPHTLNVQSEPVQIPLDQVRGTRPVWTKFLGVLPLAPNSLAVELADGTEHAFVLSGRQEWKAAIDDAVAAQRRRPGPRRPQQPEETDTTWNSHPRPAASPADDQRSPSAERWEVDLDWLWGTPPGNDGSAATLRLDVIGPGAAQAAARWMESLDADEDGVRGEGGWRADPGGVAGGEDHAVILLTSAGEDVADGLEDAADTAYEALSAVPGLRLHWTPQPRR